MNHGPAKIFVVRHGQSEWNRDKRISGQLDAPLSPKGIAQSHCLEQALRKEPLTAIYTSTLSRAQDTARPTALSRALPIHTRAGFMELHLGDLQGRFRDARDPEAQQLWEERAKDKLAFSILGGETYADLEHRVLATLSEVMDDERGGTVLIVGHRNTNRVILGHLLHWSPETAIAANPRSRYLYEITPGREPRVRTICLNAEKLGHSYDGFRE
jgi:broad specificity phosphatase PhoE